MEATETIVLYRPIDLAIIAEVYEGEKYHIPTDGSVIVYIGTLEQFLTDFPEYNKDLL